MDLVAEELTGRENVDVIGEVVEMVELVSEVLLVEADVKGVAKVEDVIVLTLVVDLEADAEWVSEVIQVLINDKEVGGLEDVFAELVPEVMCVEEDAARVAEVHDMLAFTVAAEFVWETSKVLVVVEMACEVVLMLVEADDVCGVEDVLTELVPEAVFVEAEAVRVAEINLVLLMFEAVEVVTLVMATLL
ncbi:hypothetical protein HDU98_010442, partial [Podochytrium sp. JEL0797]